MRRVALLGSFAAALTLAGASSAFAQSDIYRDLRDIRRDRADIHHDQVRLREDRVENGNWRAARYWDARRSYEQYAINGTRRDLGHDHRDLARDDADLRRDVWRYSH
jgi:hypothetical protein